MATNSSAERLRKMQESYEKRRAAEIMSRNTTPSDTLLTEVFDLQKERIADLEKENKELYHRLNVLKAELATTRSALFRARFPHKGRR